MKLAFSPSEVTILQASKSLLYQIYSAQLAIDNEAVSNQEVFEAKETIEKLLNAYERKETN